MRKKLAALAVVVLGALASVTAAQASTTIGQTGPPILDGDWNGGFDDITPAYVVPAGGGTIVSLNTQSSTCDTTFFGHVQGTYNLQVLRPMGGGLYKVLGHTGNKLDPCDGMLHSYSVNIPVQAGDVLGVYVVSSWVGLLTGGPSPGAKISEPAVGATIGPFTFGAGFALDVSGTLVQPQGTITVTKRVVSNPFDTGRFNLRIDGTTYASNVGDGGTTGAVTVLVGTHTVSETAGTDTNLGNYTARIECSDGSRGYGTSLSGVHVTIGQNTSCVITNTRKLYKVG